jgi:hypothetical protein
MRWPAFSSLAAVLLAAAPASAAPVRIASGAEGHALTVWRGAALAVVDSGSGEAPFSLVRSSGAGRSEFGSFGEPGAEFPDVAAVEDGPAYVSWGVPVSGGASLSIAPVESLDSEFSEVLGTGPGRLALLEGGTVHLAYPDRDGNATVSTFAGGESRAVRPPPRSLTTTAPVRRHLPMSAAATEDGALVLDLIQERNRTELRVLGPGAPSAPILSVRALRHFPARMTYAGGRVAVGWMERGRARVATARLGGSWSRRQLPGRGRGEGAPAPMIVDGSVMTAYVQRGDVYLAGPGRTRRLTATRGEEREPLAAAGDGDAYVAWTRREPRRGPVSTWLTRLR